MPADGPPSDCRPRYVIVELVTDDWGATEPAAYVQSRDMRGFMGTIRAVEIGPEAWPDVE